MIKVTLISNVSRKEVLVSEQSTPRKVLEDNGIDYSRSQVHMEGSTLAAGEINCTFASFGITDSCYLSVVQKADNAA